MTRTRGAPKAERADRAEERALLALLSHGLSEEEVRRVLVCALLALDQRGRDRLLARLGEETGGTLRRLLASRGRSRTTAQPSPGSAKIREEWEKAWDEWGACVAESADEDGRYVVHEHHWEEPYLDGASLAQDLEPIAAGMRKILERVQDEGLAPEFSFLTAIKDLDAEIGSGLPEWMDPSSGDGCPLGPEVTGCLLEWEWRVRRRGGRSAFDLADAIRTFEASARIVSLHADTIARFILGLGDADHQAVLKGIAAHRSASQWAEVLGAAHSRWFKIHQEIAKRWDPALFEATSRKNIAHDWELALPLLADLVCRKSFDRAGPLIEEAVRALLRLKTGEVWDPRETLLITHPSLRYRSDQHPAAFRLLESWRTVARDSARTSSPARWTFRSPSAGGGRTGMRRWRRSGESPHRASQPRATDSLATGGRWSSKRPSGPRPPGASRQAPSGSMPWWTRPAPGRMARCRSAGPCGSGWRRRGARRPRSCSLEARSER